jgi:hypothetical protein
MVDATFRRKVSELLTKLKDELDRLLAALVENNQDRKVQKAKEFLEALKSFEGILDSASHPAWIRLLEHQLVVFIDRGGTDDLGYHLARQMTKAWPQIHDWRLESAASFDFDAVYRESYDTSHIPELFDQLIDQLQQVIETEEIDSHKAIKRLQELIELLKQNKKGSYVATWTVWQFAKAALPNILSEYAKSSKAIGPIVRGVQTTMDKLDIEWSDVHDRMRQTLESKLSIDFKQLGWSAKKLTHDPANTIEGKAEPSKPQ